MQRRFLAQHSVATLFQHCNAVLHDYNFGAVVMRNIDLLCTRSIIVPSLLLHNLFMSLNLLCQEFSKPRFLLHLQDRLTGPTHVSGSELKVFKSRSRILKPGSRSLAKCRTPNDEECKPYCVTGPPRQIMPQS